jgi:phage antirepressor YoqD-like protein
MSKWTKEKVTNTFDNNLSITIRELSKLSGWKQKELKLLLLSNW